MLKKKVIRDGYRVITVIAKTQTAYGTTRKVLNVKDFTGK